MLIIYTKEDCPNCSKLKNILTKYNIEFEVVEDEKELMIIGSKSRIMSAPILELNDKFYSYIDFNNFLILFSNVLLKY